MKILVTGGLGAVGRPTVARLIRNGHTVRIADRAAPDTLRQDESDLLASATWISCDITEYAAIREAVRGQEAVLHLAAIPAPSMAPAPTLFHVNVSGTFNVFQAAAEEGIRRVVCASSINALGYYYGSVDFPIKYFPIDEDHPTFTTDAYSFSKQLNEATAAYFWRRDGITSVCLRLPAVYSLTSERGAWLKARLESAYQLTKEWLALDETARKQKLADLLLKWQRIRQQRALQAPREQWKELGYDLQDPEVGLLTGRANFWASLHAEDAAQAFEKALTADIEGCYTFFVNDDVNFALQEAETLARLFFPEVTARRRPLEGIQSLVSAEKARRVIGFVPEFSLRKSLEI